MRKNSWLYRLLAAGFTLLATAAGLPAESAAPAETPITLLATTDFHGALEGGGEDRETGRKLGTIQGLASVIERERRRNPDATLLLDAGDILQGTPISDLTLGQASIAAFNLLRVDAAALGNHELDWGIDRFRERVEQAKFPFLAANVVEKASGQVPDWVKPFAIFERRGVRIAVVGLATLATPQEAVPENVASLDFLDPVATAEKWIRELLPEQADLVILLCHFGFSQGDILGTELKDVAARARGGAAIIAGHTHERHATELAGIPVVQAGQKGQVLGKIELRWDPVERRVLGSEVSLLPVHAEEAVPQPELDEVVAVYRSELDSILGEKIGDSRIELEWDPNKECRVANLLMDAIRDRFEVDFAFQNDLGLRAPLGPGAIRLEDLYETLPFDNTVVLVSMTGSQVAELIRQADANNRLLYVAGLRYEMDLAESAGRRTSVLTPLDPQAVYKVAVNNYMAQGGIGLELLTQIEGKMDTRVGLREVLLDHIRGESAAGRPVHADLDERIVIVRRSGE